MTLEIKNNTRFTCEQLPMLDRNGANILRIVLKGEYIIHHTGDLQPAEQQPDIVMEDIYWGEPGHSSVRYESDITLWKPYTDIIINGCAYAPKGRAVHEMNVSLEYEGHLLKQLRVIGDRNWKKGLIGWYKTTPMPFVKIPIVYERAYGGSDEKGSEARNRIGTGYYTKLKSDFKGTPLPNIEHPKQLIRRPGNNPEPAGFGVISKNWEPRLSLAGTYDEDWLEGRFPLLPHDFDMRFNQSVSPDQWIRRPKGGEVIRISGMNPEKPIQVKLPPCFMNLRLRYTNLDEGKPMDLDTILIEPDECKLILTWRASADIHADPFALKEMIVGVAPHQNSATSTCC